jgi:hypothetical protein
MRTLLLAGAAVFAVVAALSLLPAATANAGNDARVRVIHASPDAPNVDVYVDGTRALADVPYKAASDYLPVPAGPHNVQVFAAGADPSGDAVIDADVTLEAGKDYTVAAVGNLAEIEPAVFADDNSAPAAGKAHVRVIHASPDAPAVDIAVKDGPVLFPNLSFPNAAGPAPVDAGTYDLEVRAAGTDTVALPLNGVQLQAGTIYTVVAIGLVNGEPALEALTLTASPGTETTPPPSTDAPALAPGGALPNAGFGRTASGSGDWALYAGLVAGAGLAAAGAGVATARRRS